MVKLTYKQLAELITPALAKLNDVEMPAVIALRVAKISAVIDSALIPFNKAQQSIVERHGLKPGDLITDAYVADITELLAETIDLNFDKLTEEDVGKMGDVKPSILFALEAIIG